MELNKKAIQCIALLCVLCMFSITAVTTNVKSGKYESASQEGQTSNDTIVAGMAAQFADYEWELDEYQAHAVSIQRTKIDIVSTAAREEEDSAAENNTEEEKSAEELEWENYLMADVSSFLYVREAADPEAAVVGKLYKGDLAEIVEVGTEWTQITSGNVEGYVSNEYSLTGTSALAYAKENCVTVATATVNSLHIRKEPTTESGIATTLEEGDELTVDTTAETAEGWIAVLYKSKTCYVSADYVTIALDTGKAVTLKEEAAAIAAEQERKEKEAAANAAAAQTTETTTTTGSSLAASADEVTLLAALIQCEVGGLSYECQLAVGAVVVNRIKSGVYPNTMYEVIYQRSQFGPAGSGKLERRLSSGVSATAMQAAAEALSGVDNTGGATGFKFASSGHAGTVIGPIVFF